MTALQQTPPPGTNYNDIALRELFRMLWAGKWLIGGVTVAASLISVIAVLLIPNVYRAETLLAPNQQENGSGLSSLAAQYGGLASLAGINLSGGGADKTALGLEILKSRKFVSEFIVRHDILVPLIAAKGWDYQTGELEIDSSLYDTESERWVRKVNPPKKAVPSLQEAYEKFSEIFSVDQDINSGFVTVAIEHYSPIIAKQWVEKLVEDVNAFIMHQDVAEAEQAIEYLQQQVASTSLADLQNVFFRLIEEQTKTVMLARVSSEYLLRTLDPPVAPEKKFRPNRSLIVILSALLGFLLGTAVVWIMPPLRGQKISNRPAS